MKRNQLETRPLMTSLKQIEANRRNARKSTGPRTEAGKARARRNAIRHGLTAETVIEPLENPEDYEAFEMSIAAEFDAQTAVERELILRLASVLWRLRRSTAIETGLLQTAEPDEERPARQVAGAVTDSVFSLMEAALRGRLATTINEGEAGCERPMNDARPPEGDTAVDRAESGNAELALRFLHLAKFDNGVFERLSRYETALWRQVGHLLFALNFMHRPPRRHSAFPTRRDNPFLFGSRR
jgi:hypothetical protein